MSAAGATGEGAGGYARALGVAHSFDVWLPATMTWAYNQVRFTPRVEAVVLAERFDHPARFPWEPLVGPAGGLEGRLIETAARRGQRLYPRAFGRALRRRRPAVLHSHFGYRGWKDLPLARRHGMRHVVTFYGHDVTMYPRRWPVWRQRYEELFATADLFLCEGPFMASTLVAAGCPQDKVRVQRLGVEMTRFASEPRRLGDDGVLRVLIAGAFREKKGIPLALEALGRLGAGGQAVEVTLIGDAGADPREQAEKRRILEALRRAGLKDRVRPLGFVSYDRLLEEAYRHHVFLSPSVTAADGDSEGGAPLAIIEMAATGMPVVSTTHCDIPEVVVDGETGLLAAEGDVGGLVERLQRLAEHPELLSQMGAAGRGHVEERFDVRRCAAQLREVYGGLAGER